MQTYHHISSVGEFAATTAGGTTPTRLLTHPHPSAPKYDSTGRGELELLQHRVHPGEEGDHVQFILMDLVILLDSFVRRHTP